LRCSGTPQRLSTRFTPVEAVAMDCRLGTLRRGGRICDVVLVRSDPRDVARIVEFSRPTYRKMVRNLWWAAGGIYCRFAT
jgi:hypothetical protein